MNPRGYHAMSEAGREIQRAKARERMQARWADPEWAEWKRWHMREVAQPMPTSGPIPGQYCQGGQTREDVRHARSVARKRAERILKKLEYDGIIDKVPGKIDNSAETLVDNEQAAARAAMKEVLIQVLMPGSRKDKLAAARTILEYTKSKPASKSDVKVDAPEDFLVALLNKETS